MKNVFITVHPDTDSSYASVIHQVSKHSQIEILVPLGNNIYHQDYTFSFSRLENSNTDPIYVFEEKLPLDWSFIIEQQLDTVWIKSFKVN